MWILRVAWHTATPWTQHCDMACETSACRRKLRRRSRRPIRQCGCCGCHKLASGFARQRKGLATLQASEVVQMVSIPRACSATGFAIVILQQLHQFISFQQHNEKEGGANVVSSPQTAPRKMCTPSTAAERHPISLHLYHCTSFRSYFPLGRASLMGDADRAGHRHHSLGRPIYVRAVPFVTTLLLS